MRQIPLAIGITPPRSLEQFVPGANAAAVAHLAALAPGAPPVYLWGPSGSGKSHLLEAVVRRAQQRGEHAGFFHAAQPPPWRSASDWSLVALDDCDAYDEARQHAAFSVFVEANAQGIPVVAAGRVPPVDLPLRDDLRSRLGWGHVFALQPLSETEARATLRREADRRGVFLSDEVMDYLLRHFERDLKHLMAQLQRLDTFSLASKRPITVPLLKEMLADEGAS